METSDLREYQGMIPEMNTRGALPHFEMEVKLFFYQF
jgi:hypothetical protein